MIFLDLINLQKVRRALLHIICIVLALWLQTMVLSRVEIFGAKPFFLPAVIVAIGLWEGGVWGAVLGMLAGAYCDMCAADSRVLFLVLFTAYGFLSGLLADYLINRRFVSYLLLTAIVLVFTGLCQIVPLWIFRGAALGALLRTALLQALWALPLAVPCYFIAKRIAGRERSR